MNNTNTSDASDNDSVDEDLSIYDTDDEVAPEPIPTNIMPIPGQSANVGQPLMFDVNMTEDVQSSSLPNDELS